MIAQRFRSLGWVAGVTTAAVSLYMVSLQVAAERGKLESVERQIALAQRNMRQLQTELGTRASLRQLEKWNGDVLALSAPKAQQFLHGEAELASLGSGAIDDGTPNAPPAVMNASFSSGSTVLPLAPVKTEVATIRTAALETVVVTTKKPRLSKPRVPVESASIRAGFQRAIYERPERAISHVQRVAMLDARILRDIDKSADKERRKRP
ncbi:hypothetical protein [Sphingomonas sp.]|uniref:hypothetical protein n=1 Tax=Sphingomonas sp. TaxID=28214 RepID=UPI0025E958A5|nr:hypothetical protein [Sphingomonas sp.]